MKQTTKKAEYVNWMFTKNNPAETPQQLEDVLRPFCNGYVFQLEKGEEGTPHYQGCIRLKKKKQPHLMAKHIFQAHWTAVTNTLAKAWNYCKKEDTRLLGPWTWGNGPVEKGERTDMDECCDMIKGGSTLAEIAEVYPSQIVRYAQHFDRFRSLWRPERTEQLKVVLLYGRPGSGKTRWAYQHFPKLYALPVGKDLWFNSYQQQKDVLIDDFAGNVGLTQLLQILDRYPVQLPTKGGFVWWCPTRILLTSNMRVDQWYNYDDRQDSYEALTRRLTMTITFPIVSPEDLEKESTILGTNEGVIVN